MKKNIIILTGPTASGKSDLAIQIAKKINGAVINMDSLQVYKFIPITTASPTEYHGIEHFLFNYVEPGQHYSFGIWQKDALSSIKKIISMGKVPILVGGTAMYARKACDGISPAGQMDTDITKDFIEGIGKNELLEMYEFITSRDNRLKSSISPNDKSRIIKSYLFYKQNNMSTIDFHKSNPPVDSFAEFNKIKLLLLPDKASVIKSCDNRFIEMLKKGAQQEVEHALSKIKAENLTFSKAIGFNELRMLINNEINIQDCIDEVNRRNKKFIKHQYTWFNNKFADFFKIDSNEKKYFLEEIKRQTGQN